MTPYVEIFEVEYEWFGDEGDQYAEGDHDNARRTIVSCLPDRYDIEEGKSWVELALDALNDQPCYLEPNCSPIRLGNAPSWFSGSDHKSRKAIETGTWDEYSVHFHGFTGLEMVEIAQRYSA
jgi:hypothetical protein